MFTFSYSLFEGVHFSRLANPEAKYLISMAWKALILKGEPQKF
jgi:hypothetical protein